MPRTTNSPDRRKQSNNQPGAAASKREPAARPKQRRRAPNLEPLDSDLLEAVSYDEATGTLTARYRTTGDTYVYEEVPRQVYEELLTADAKTRFFEKWVAGKSYPSHKAA